MSRIGKQQITVPVGVIVGAQSNALTVKGPKGELKLSLHPDVAVITDKDTVAVQVKNENNKIRVIKMDESHSN